jgi:hypothetical protein
LLWFHTLFFGCYYVKGEDGNHGSVHRHRNRHFIQRYLVEQNFHVQYRIDGNACFPNVTRYPFMIRIVSAVRGEIKRY